MTDPKAIALAYLSNIHACAPLLAPDVTFTGPASTYTGADGILAAFRRLAGIHVRNDIQRLFVDGDEVCAIYDFVTDTMGSMPTIEWLKVRDGKIASIRLYYDQVPWLKIREEIARRAAA